MLIAFFEAQHINIHSGGAVVAPWDLLDGITLQEWAEAALLLSKAPAIRRRLQAIQKVFEDARRRHPQYAKLHRLKPLHGKPLLN